MCTFLNNVKGEALSHEVARAEPDTILIFTQLKDYRMNENELKIYHALTAINSFILDGKQLSFTNNGEYILQDGDNTKRANYSVSTEDNNYVLNLHGLKTEANIGISIQVVER